MADFHYNREHCHFFTKTGACHFGNRCSRIHTHPTISHALILPNMYQRPDLVDPTKLQEHFEDFYEDIFEELSCFGEIESLCVCDNLVDHMIGNVYVVFKDVHQAAAALQAFRTRAYCGRPIVVEFLAVRNIGLVKCREFPENKCNRGRFCNYMHERLIGRGLWKKLFGKCRRDYCGGYDSASGMGQYWSWMRARSPVRERSEERRVRIEMWNKEREESEERRARIEMWNREGSEERRARIEMWNRERERERRW